jgi:hypothetical protein
MQDAPLEKSFLVPQAPHFSADSSAPVKPLLPGNLRPTVAQFAWFTLGSRFGFREFSSDWTARTSSRIPDFL